MMRSMNRRLSPFVLAIAVWVFLSYSIMNYSSDIRSMSSSTSSKHGGLSGHIIAERFMSPPIATENQQLPQTQVERLQAIIGDEPKEEPQRTTSTPSFTVSFPYGHLAQQSVPLKTLRLCRERNRKLNCVNNPTCERDECMHVNAGTFMVRVFPHIFLLTH